MEQPGLNEGRPTSDDDVTNAKRMLILFGVFTVLFVCGGGVVTGIMGADSESAGVSAAMASTGPACCALAGLLAAGISLLALKGKSTAQIVFPLIAGVLGGAFGGIGIVVFFQVIWPSL